MTTEPPSASALQAAIDRLGAPPYDFARPVRTLLGLAKELGRRRPDPKRLGWALFRLAEYALADMERQRVVDDDRPEAALAIWRRWCLGEETDAGMGEARWLLYDAHNDARKRGAESLRGFVHLYLLHSLATEWPRGGVTPERAADALDLVMVTDPNDSPRAAGEKVMSVLRAALSEPMPRTG